MSFRAQRGISTLGLAGSGLGLIAGALFAWRGAGLVLEEGGVPAVPPLPAGPLVAAVALGMLASLAGALGPAIGAAQQPPLELLRTLPPVIPRSATPPPVILRSAAPPPSF